jgi:tRNA dimethylallyltransferase
MVDRSGTGIAIMGATATGKSAVAIRLAREFGGEIVSMDSRQVYRGLDIGTAKVLLAERQGVAHHLIDLLDPTEAHSAGRHVALADAVVADIRARGRVPILVGGTGLYFRVYFHGLIDASIGPARLETIRKALTQWTTAALYAELQRVDPERARELSENDRVRIARAVELNRGTGKTYSELRASQPRRPGWRGVKIVLTLPREELRRRIAQRTRDMFAAGWVAEVRGLLRAGCAPGAPAMRSLGYGAIARAVVSGEKPASVVARVITQTQQYAKRQETFFRSEDETHWVDVSHDDAEAHIHSLVRSIMA